mmetsp:Transcript_22805/g.32830  ORF Transcript_22805/g.32830 Transcript_22805/m.32830 type:complete len:310 (+) Transcript_22805:386-1315(+)
MHNIIRTFDLHNFINGSYIVRSRAFIIFRQLMGSRYKADRRFIFIYCITNFCRIDNVFFSFICTLYIIFPFSSIPFIFSPFVFSLFAFIPFVFIPFVSFQVILASLDVFTILGLIVQRILSNPAVRIIFWLLVLTVRLLVLVFVFTIRLIVSVLVYVRIIHAGSSGPVTRRMRSQSRLNVLRLAVVLPIHVNSFSFIFLLGISIVSRVHRIRIVFLSCSIILLFFFFVFLIFPFVVRVLVVIIVFIVFVIVLIIPVIDCLHVVSVTAFLRGLGSFALTLIVLVVRHVVCQLYPFEFVHFASQMSAVARV